MPNKIKKILICEDEKPIAKALVLKLNHEGFEAEAANDGEEALQILQSKQFDLILLDLIMPRIDGFGVLEKIKELKITTPVIVTSNLGQEEDLKRAKELGAVNYFIKSNTSLQEIVDGIKKL